MIWSLPGMWGLAYWWSPVLPVGGRWARPSSMTNRQPSACEIDDAQLVAAEIDGNTVVLDCLTGAELVTLRARLTRKAVRQLRPSMQTWKTSSEWVGVTVAKDLRTVHLAGGARKIELHLEQPR